MITALRNLFRRRTGQPTPVTTLKENHGTKVAVTSAYYWEPMDTAPMGCKLQLKSHHGVAVYGVVTSNTKSHWAQWAPLPATRKEPK